MTTLASGYLATKQPSSRRMAGVAAAVLFHALLLYGLVNGLGHKVIAIIKQPLQTKIIEEVKPPPPPPETPPPPPPKLAAPPPPFIPPPEVKIATPPPPAPTIAVVPQEKPPAPAPAVVTPPPAPAAEVKAAPPPPPPPTKQRFRSNVKPIYTPPVEELAAMYPRQAAREGITGRVVVHITVAPSGDVKDAVIKDSQPKKVFDKAALEYVRRYKFEKGDDEFETEQEIIFNLSN